MIKVLDLRPNARELAGLGPEPTMAEAHEDLRRKLEPFESATRAEVTGCADCPMRYDGEAGVECSHPDAPEGVDNYITYDVNINAITPDWCPLRKAPLLVALRKT